MPDSLSTSTGTRLTEWEDAVIDLFVSVGDSLGFPRSMVQIYGLLYCSPGPQSMEEIVDRLQISKGSASQGLRQLVLLGAVRKETVIGDRRTLYSPERSLKRLAAYFLDAHLQPRLQQGTERIAAIASLVPEGDAYEFARSCTDSLLTWNRKARRIVPILSRVVK